MTILQVCDVVRSTSFSIHSYFRGGHLERVYENALVHRLRKANLKVHQQFPIHVRDEDGTPVGRFVADIVVEDILIIELKACPELLREHMAQALGYLRASRLEHAMLINFGPARLEVKKLILSAAGR